MRHRIKATAAATSLVLLLGAAACGDDDDDAATDTTAAEGDGAAVTAACDALIEFNGAATSIEIDDTSSEEDIKAAGEELVDLWAPVVEGAPGEIGDAAEELNSVLVDMAGGDPEGFNSDATFESYTGIVADLSSECGYKEVAVAGVDYGFEGVPATIEAGYTTFAFTNESDAEEHEMIVVRKADGVDLTFDEILELSEEESESMVEFKAATFAPPGGSNGAIADLDPGEYVMVCFIPVGGGEDGPPHFTQGMKQEFTVE